MARGKNNPSPPPHAEGRFAIEEPDPETVIWKYLDFAKYVSLLRARCLHLAPAVEFSDRYEGDVGIVQKRGLIRRYGQAAYEKKMEIFSRLRERTYVSSWTENEFESDAMWRIYTGASYGVAIRSTYRRLKCLLPTETNRGSRRCYSGLVKYVDFNRELLPLEAYGLPYFYKRRSFEHEREVRVVIQESPDLEKSEPAKKIEITKKQLNDLVLSVHLSPGAPKWFADLVRDINKDFALDRAPITSMLDQIPEDIDFDAGGGVCGDRHPQYTDEASVRR